MPGKPIKSTPKTALRRYGDITLRTSKAHIARLAFLLAGILIILATASLVFVGHFASEEADRQAVANQQSLLKTALDGRFILIARDQLSLARWDRAVRKISLQFDEDFVTDEFIDSLWFDFGLDRNLLVNGNNDIVADAREAEVNFDTGEMSHSDPLFQFVELARNQYLQNRIKLPDGFGQRPVPFGEEFLNPVYGFIAMDDAVALVHAMAVVPDDGTAVLPDGNPVVLISALYVDADLIKELNDQLSFSKMHFARSIALNTSHNRYPVLSSKGQFLGEFSWKAHLPGRWIWRTIIPVIIVLGSILGVVAFAIAWRIGTLTLSLAKSEEQNLHLAMFDSLSGLANRLHYNRALAGAVEQLPSRQFTLVQCDLDKFKQVNYTHGHGAGDIVIREVGGRLVNVVQDTGLVCRTGGDEFVILLDLIDRSAINSLTNQIIQSIEQPIEVAPDIFTHVGISLGIATAPAHGDSAGKIMAAADQALYKAKEEGRNRAEFYEDIIGQ